MDTITAELEKNGIKVICPINTFNANEVATHVSRLLFSKFPELKIDYVATFSKISHLKMYIADMPFGMSDACYFYKNESIYFRKGLKFEDIKNLAFHEVLHHFQEIKDSYGVLHRMGLCSYVGINSYGNALNEAAVQLMSSYAIGEKRDIVKYYGITLPTDSPSYYPLLCNLVKQLGYIIGFPVLFESTFYANDAFFDKFKEIYGDGIAFKIQQNFEKLLKIEEKIIRLNMKIQTSDMSYFKFKNSTDSINHYKAQIRNVFLGTQNMIVSNFFNYKIKNLNTANDVEECRKNLYSFTNLIGTAENYRFFGEFYNKTIKELDKKYEQIINNRVPMVVNKSKFSIAFKALRNLFGANASQRQSNIN